MHEQPSDVLALLPGVLPGGLASPVNGNFAVALHLKFDRVILTEQAIADQKPLPVAEGAAGVLGAALESRTASGVWAWHSNAEACEGGQDDG